MGLMERLNKTAPSETRSATASPARPSSDAVRPASGIFPAAKPAVEPPSVAEESSPSSNELEIIRLSEQVRREAATVLAKQQGTQTAEDITALIDAIISEDAPELSRRDRASVAKNVLDEITGFGPLEVLLEDSSVSEIMVNGPKQIYVERRGKLVKAPVTFQDDEHVRRIIDRIVSPLAYNGQKQNRQLKSSILSILWQGKYSQSLF